MSIQKKGKNKNLGGITPARLGIDKNLKHFGPFNEIEDIAPDDPVDRAAWEHDIHYGKYGSGSYWRGNEADKKFINDTANDSRYVVQIGRKYFQLKQYISEKLGTNYSKEDEERVTADFNRDKRIMSNKRKANFDREQNKSFNKTRDDLTGTDHGTKLEAPPTPITPAIVNKGTPDNLGKAVEKNLFSHTPDERLEIGESVDEANMDTDPKTQDSSAPGAANKNDLEVIPNDTQHPMGKSRRFRTNSTFRAYYEQQAISTPTSNEIVPIRQGGNIAGDPAIQGPRDYQQITAGANNSQLTTTTRWCYIPNNNMKLYITPAQMASFISSGAIGYRVRGLKVKLYGLYNMQTFQVTESLRQGADPGYAVIMEPKNNYPFKNQTRVNYQFDGLLNPNPVQTNFDIADTYDFSSYFNYTGSAATVNALVAAKINIPGIPDVTLINDATKALTVISDVSRHSKQTIIRNGENYEWSWQNPDGRYINLYRSTYNPFSVDYYNDHGRSTFPLQILQDNYECILDSYVMDNPATVATAENPTALDQPWCYQTLHYGNQMKFTEIPPILFQIPMLQQLEGEDMTHSAWMYLDYHIDIEFLYGETPTYYNAPNYTSNYGFQSATQLDIFKLTETKGNIVKGNYVADNVLFDRQSGYSTTGKNDLQRRWPPQQQAQSAYTSAWDYKPTNPAAPT